VVLIQTILSFFTQVIPLIMAFKSGKDSQENKQKDKVIRNVKKAKVGRRKSTNRPASVKRERVRGKKPKR
jgi:hypothetical protein